MNEVFERHGLTVTIIETPSLGDRSYVVDDGSSALVIDPQRDIDRVTQVLAKQGVQLAAVAETHAHNDYVSGGLELARAASVPYLVPCEAEAIYARTQVCGEDVLHVDSMTVRAIGTPGHTPHHVAFAVGQSDQPSLVFTGGSMLFGSVGRTDLVRDDLTVALTRQQYGSVRRLADELPGDTPVLPTHGFGSFCSATPTDGSASTVAEQVKRNPVFTQSEDEFVRSLLAGLDPYPAYYAHMAPLNLAGPAPVDLSPVREADSAEVLRRIERGEWVVDLRDRQAFARGHVPGTLKFEAGDSLAIYLGWLIPWGIPLTLIGESARQVAGAQRELVRIGIDRPAAQATAPVERLAGGQELAGFTTVNFAQLAEAWGSRQVHVLDVRREGEWDSGHVRGAQHIPLHELVDRIDEVPDQHVWVHCASGVRASIAASLLEVGGKCVTAIADDFAAASRCGLALTTNGSSGDRGNDE